MRVVRPASRDQRSARDTTYDPRTGSPPPERTAHSVRTVDRRLSSRSFRSRQSRWVHDRRIGPEETVAYANEPDSEPDPTTWNRRRRTNGAWWNPKQVPRERALSAIGYRDQTVGSTVSGCASRSTHGCRLSVSIQTCREIRPKTATGANSQRSHSSNSANSRLLPDLRIRRFWFSLQPVRRSHSFHDPRLDRSFGRSGRS